MHPLDHNVDLPRLDHNQPSLARYDPKAWIEIQDVQTTGDQKSGNSGQNLLNTIMLALWMLAVAYAYFKCVVWTGDTSTNDQANTSGHSTNADNPKTNFFIYSATTDALYNNEVPFVRFVRKNTYTTDGNYFVIVCRVRDTGCKKYFLAYNRRQVVPNNTASTFDGFRYPDTNEPSIFSRLIADARHAGQQRTRHLTHTSMVANSPVTTGLM